jgi:ABC-type sugar transport system ATPase subunit
MVGRALEEIVPPADSVTEEPRACVFAGSPFRGVRERRHRRRAGKIVGLAGLVGQGEASCSRPLRAASARAGHGRDRREPCSFRNPREAIGGAAAFVPADRKLQGLVLDMSVHENLVMASTSRLTRVRRPSRTREQAIVAQAIDELQIRAHSARVPVSTLSGGNQQKIVLGKWLAADRAC